MPHKNSPKFQAFNHQPHHANVAFELGKLNQQHQTHLEHQRDLAKRLLATTATPMLPPIILSPSVKKRSAFKPLQTKVQQVKAEKSNVSAKPIKQALVKKKSKAKAVEPKVIKKRVTTLKAKKDKTSRTTKASKSASAKTAIKRKVSTKKRTTTKVPSIKSKRK